MDERPGQVQAAQQQQLPQTAALSARQEQQWAQAAQAMPEPTPTRLGSSPCQPGQHAVRQPGEQPVAALPPGPTGIWLASAGGTAPGEQAWPAPDCTCIPDTLLEELSPADGRGPAAPGVPAAGPASTAALALREAGCGQGRGPAGAVAWMAPNWTCIPDTAVTLAEPDSQLELAEAQAPMCAPAEQGLLSQALAAAGRPPGVAGQACCAWRAATHAWAAWPCSWRVRGACACGSSTAGKAPCRRRRGASETLVWALQDHRSPAPQQQQQWRSRRCV